jgi:hypothetical protein
MLNTDTVKVLILILSLNFIGQNLSAQDTFSGNVFLDHNSDRAKNNNDVDHGGVRIRAYDDTNNNSVLDASDIVIDSDITDAYGDYSLSLMTSGGTITKSLYIQRSKDDAEEDVSDGSVGTTSSDTELVYESGSNEQIVGLRFDGIKIPKGVTITNAYIRFQAKASNSGTCNLTIRGENTGASRIFSNRGYDISSRSTTSNSVNWSPGSWSSPNYYNSDNLATILNELNARSDWSESSPVTFIITGTGEREPWSYDGSGTAAQLVVEFTNPYAGTRYFITLETSELTAGSTITSPVSTYYTYATGLGATSNVDFGFNGEIETCYSFSDAGQNAGLSLMNRVTGREFFIGTSGAYDVEAMAIHPITQTFYLAETDLLYTVDPLTGTATALGSNFGTGSSVSLGISETFSDVDGLAFDPITNVLYGTHRNGTNDILFKIDHTTGAYIPDAFGTGEDFVVVDDIGSTIPDDIDDIGIDPEDGKLYGIANTTNFDLLVEIDKITGIVSIIDTVKNGAGDIIRDVEGFTFTNYGQPYAVSGNGSLIYNTLWSIDITTAVATEIGTFSYGDDYESCSCLTAKSNTVSGNVFEDVNGNGIKEGGDTGQQNITVYMYRDDDGDGKISGGDTLIDSTDTDINGDWSWAVGYNTDLLFSIDIGDLPVGFVMITDNAEEALLDISIGGQTDANNNFSYNFTGPLPVELTAFNGYSENCKNYLSWQTETESNFNFFEIERSLDGQTFVHIATIDGKNDSNGSLYSLQDRAFGSNNYYRLKIIDLDGSFEYSDILLVRSTCRENNGVIKIYPNPIQSSDGVINIIPKQLDKPTEIRLTNMSGQILYEYYYQSGAFRIDLSNLPPGFYSIQGKNDQSRFSEKVIVIRD